MNTDGKLLLEHTQVHFPLSIILLNLETMSTTIGQVLTLNHIIWKQISTSMVRDNVNTEETIPYYRGQSKPTTLVKILFMLQNSFLRVLSLNAQFKKYITSYEQWKCISVVQSTDGKTVQIYLSSLATVRILE